MGAGEDVGQHDGRDDGDGRADRAARRLEQDQDADHGHDEVGRRRQARPLGDVLEWQRPRLGPGCFCEVESREHKWGLVLETIHYALTHGAGPTQGPPLQ